MKIKPTGKKEARGAARSAKPASVWTRLPVEFPRNAEFPLLHRVPIHNSTPLVEPEPPRAVLFLCKDFSR